MIYPELEDMKKRIENITELTKSKTLKIGDIEELINYILESDENYFKFIIVVDAASRSSDVFNVITTLHKKLKDIKNSNYTKKYWEISGVNENLAKVFATWQQKYTNKEWFKRPLDNFETIKWLSNFINENSDSKLFKVSEDESSKF
jgi:hypothetical protein